MKRSNVLIAVYLVLIFTCGVVVGAFASRLYWPTPVIGKQAPPRPNPEEWRRQYVNEMQTRLKLTPEQLITLNQILDETGKKVHTEHERHVQEMKAIREEQVGKNLKMLTPEQIPQYEKIRQEHERRRAAEQGNRK
jgi:hypothetical protein